MEENNRFKYSNFNEVFGELQNVYYIKRGAAEKIFVPAVLFFLIPFGVITYVASKDWWTIPCCIVVPVLLFCLAVWQIYTTRKDELRIYENGFTHKSGKNLQSCLWTEVETYTYRERNSREIAELPDDVFPLGSVEKQNGEVIGFDFDLPGTPELTEKFAKHQPKAKLKE